MEGSIKSQKMETLKSSTSTLKLFKHNTCANVLHFITGKKKIKKNGYVNVSISHAESRKSKSKSGRTMCL